MRLFFPSSLLVVSSTFAQQNNIKSSNVRNMENDNGLDCSDIPKVLREGSLEEKLPHASGYFRSKFDPDDFLAKFIFANEDDNKIRADLCSDIAKGPAYNVISCLAEEEGTTIGLDFGTDISLFGIKMEYVVSLLWGENGQFACAYNDGLGGSLDLLGFGASLGVSLRSISNGGWDTVAPGEKRLCLTAGYTALVGLAATLAIDPNVLVDAAHAINMIDYAIKIGTWDHDMENLTEVFQAILGKLSELAKVDGVTSVGVEANAAYEFLDMALVGLLIPDISVTICDERLVYCIGEGCEKKMMA